MKIFLYVLAAIFFVLPLAFMTWAIGMTCAYATGSSQCGISLSDYFDTEFLPFVIPPWAIAGILVYFARGLGKK